MEPPAEIKYHCKTISHQNILFHGEEWEEEGRKKEERRRRRTSQVFTWIDASANILDNSDVVYSC